MPRPRNLKPNVIADCAVCGHRFERYLEPSKLKSGKAKGIYCSRQCKGKALSGKSHPLWKGGRCVVNGYVWIHRPDHPHAKHQGYVLEHRLVMEAHIGRHLEPAEVVHHMNDDTQDNRIENLQLYATNADHKRDDYRSRKIDGMGRFLPKQGVSA